MRTMLCAAVGGYLAGAIPFAYLVAKIFAGVDPRTVGSRNPGATNVYRSVGKAAGAAALALDAAKGFAAVVFFKRLFGPDAAALAGICCVAGHTYTVFLGFKGGKGVATGLGVFTALAPAAVLAAAAVFAPVYGLTKYVSAGSLAAAATLPAAAYIAGYPPSAVGASCAAALLVVFRHRSNIKRLLRKEEVKTRL